MRFRAALAAALFLPAARVPGAELPPAVAEVAQLLPGSYVSRDPGRSLRVSVTAVPKNRFAPDAPVFYLEAARAARPDAPFLQRFLRLDAEGAGVAVRVYEPRDLAGVRGKWREPDALSIFTARDVRERPDCRMTLAKAPAGHWAGGTAAATCFSGAASVRLAISMTLSPQTLEWREEGKDAAGKTVTGPSGEITIFGRDGGFSLKVNEPAAQAPAALEVLGPSSISKKYDLVALRAMAAGAGLSLARLVPAPDAPSAAVVVVTSKGGALSVFSFAEISSSSSPSLDVSGPAPRLVAAPGRGLDDVVSIELRVLAR